MSTAGSWIPIEHDHERFGGYLKVSLDELIIALRDDRHLLSDPAGLRSGGAEQIDDGSPETDQSGPCILMAFPPLACPGHRDEAVWDDSPRR